jgi:hypothetical protein
MSNIFGGGTVGLYLFLYLLPGILGELVYEFIVEGEKRETLDRIAGALVLALISALAPPLLFGLALTPHVEVRNETPPDVILEAFLQPRHLIVTTLVAAIVAALFAVVQNHGWLYRLLRTLRMTKKTGDNDIWQQTFYLYPDRWVSLELADGRRLVGWPSRFSSSGQPRALLLGNAKWYSFDEDGKVREEIVAGPGVYVGKFDDIVAIEILD